MYVSVFCEAVTSPLFGAFTVVVMQRLAVVQSETVSVIVTHVVAVTSEPVRESVTLMSTIGPLPPKSASPWSRPKSSTVTSVSKQAIVLEEPPLPPVPGSPPLPPLPVGSPPLPPLPLGEPPEPLGETHDPPLGSTLPPPRMLATKHSTVFCGKPCSIKTFWAQVLNVAGTQSITLFTHSVRTASATLSPTTANSAPALTCPTVLTSKPS